MKSETTKTNVPAGKLDACRTSTLRQPSSDGGPAAAARPRVRLDALEDRSGGPGESQRGDFPAARRRRAHRPPRPPRGRSTRPPPRRRPACRATERRPVEPHPRPPVDGERDQRGGVGEELTDDELVGPPGGGEPCRGAPVDPGPRGRPAGTGACRRPRRPGRGAGCDAGRTGRRRTADAGRGRTGRSPAGLTGPPVRLPPPSSARAAEPAQAGREDAVEELALALSLPISASAERIRR